MPTTDFERDDELDRLSSEELEERVFGPDPDAPRRTPRGLVPSPGPRALTARNDAADEAPRRWPLVVVGSVLVILLALLVVVFSVTNPESDPSPIESAPPPPPEAPLRPPPPPPAPPPPPPIP